MSSSQFEELFKARKTEKKPPEKKKQGSSKKRSPTPPAVEKKKVVSESEKKITTVAKSDKSSDFEQTLVYLKKDTKKEVKKSLIDDTSGKDFSDLVEELLADWLKKKS